MKNLYYLLPILIMLQACNSSEKDSGVKAIEPTGKEKYLNETSDYVFDQSKIPVFELTIPEKHLEILDQAPRAEEYVEASLTFEGETISPIGVRYKGSIGAFVGCLSDSSNLLAPSGYKICNKLSMKIKINWNGNGLKFYGLKKIQLHSQNLDPTKIRERLGYWLFSAMDIPSPRSIHAKLMINGKYSGLYALTEQIDGRFTRYHYNEGKGNVYKEIWPLTGEGAAQPEDAFINSLKTNEDDDPSVALIHDFAKAIEMSNDDAELKAAISNWMNPEEILTYAVVDRTIRHDDGPFHWYCTAEECFNHNFYWYEEPEKGMIHLVPWDLDNAFENIREGSVDTINTVTRIGDAWGEIRDDCQPYSLENSIIPQRSAACDRLTYGWSLFDDEYQSAIARFKTGPFAEANVNSLLDTWAEQIEPAIRQQHERYGDEISVEAWKAELDALKADLQKALNALP